MLVYVSYSFCTVRARRKRQAILLHLFGVQPAAVLVQFLTRQCPLLQLVARQSALDSRAAQNAPVGVVLRPMCPTARARARRGPARALAVAPALPLRKGVLLRGVVVVVVVSVVTAGAIASRKTRRAPAQLPQRCIFFFVRRRLQVQARDLRAALPVVL